MADRAFGRSASPRRSAQAPGLPVSRARRSPAAPPDCALVCFGFGPKRSRRSIRLPRPVVPPCLLVSGKPAVNHTHMSAEAYPPDGPRTRPRQGSQNFSARGPRRRGRSGVRCHSCGERCARNTFAPGQPAATPSLTRTDSATRYSAMPPHSRDGPSNIWR